ncbi:hypothetical protein G7048_06050 [Diaphorobacter sp. HDW4B]|uniref:hypothetical protein n=1 Tax=Diaphorobacter sp. HDW4B TaxID=2714925 RepID=UPI00140E0A58|nr:hypothetical protein [Diaphorobacter sp. HDW4B]QIL69958.1 hypothetical protein G7048_06050 [Diaphorobacter sp. HDW4B]
MSARQTAVINGLLAENVGKNDLVRSAQAKAIDADRRASDAEHRARMNEGSAQHIEVLRNNIAKLQYELSEANSARFKLIDENAALTMELAKYKQQANEFRSLLSRPMKEIADMSGDFKKAYEVQQQMLAEWIMGQKAYKETAMQLGMEVGKSSEEIQQLATQNANAVLENRTEHGNDSTTSPTLADHASAILAIRRKNGKA